MSAQERIYTLIVKGQRIPVTQAVYRAYYQEYEHERYLKKKSAAHEHSLEALVETGVSIDFYCVTSQSPVEDTLVAIEQAHQLRECLSLLSPEEQVILAGIFYYEQSAKQLAVQLGVSASAVGYRKQKALQKLKELLVR